MELGRNRTYITLILGIAVVAVIGGGYFLSLDSRVEVPIDEPFSVDSDGGVFQVGDYRVTVPAGALDQKAELAVHPVSDSGSVPGPLFAEPIGGADFKPDGLSFNTPITVTIPLSESYEPGTALPLFLLNEEKEQYEDTNTTATVLADGRTAEATITHFSKYVLFKGWEQVKEKLSHPDIGDPKDLAFMDEMVELLGNLYDVGLGQEQAYKGQCYRIVGAGYGLNIRETDSNNALMQEYYDKYKPLGKTSKHPQNITRIASVGGSVERLQTKQETVEGESKDTKVLENFNGSYTLTVEINLEPCGGKFSIEGFEVTPGSVEPGKEVGIFAQVMNVGKSAGKRTVEIRVGDTIELSREVSLDPNVYTDLFVDVRRQKEGTYSVTVDAVEAKASKKFQVKKEEEKEELPPVFIDEEAKEVLEEMKDNLQREDAGGLKPAPAGDHPAVPALPPVETNN